MTAGHLALGCLTLAFLLLLVDDLAARIPDWYRRRRREREMRKYCMLPGAFKPTKANSWWEA
jgi:hypothetical protein